MARDILYGHAQTARHSHFSSNKDAVQACQIKAFMRPLLKELIEQTWSQS